GLFQSDRRQASRRCATYAPGCPHPRARPAFDSGILGRLTAVSDADFGMDFALLSAPPTCSAELLMHAHETIKSHPHVSGNMNDQLVKCIEECYDCAQTCVSCADACLGESGVESLVQCIRLDLDCADMCQAMGTVASRRTGANETLIMSMLEACAL